MPLPGAISPAETGEIRARGEARRSEVDQSILQGLVRFGDVNVADNRCTTSRCRKAIIPGEKNNRGLEGTEAETHAERTTAQDQIQSEDVRDGRKYPDCNAERVDQPCKELAPGPRVREDHIKEPEGARNEIEREVRDEKIAAAASNTAARIAKARCLAG